MNSDALFQLGVSLSKRGHCPFCRAAPSTNNPARCTCEIDCHAEWCGRVGSGEPERAPVENTRYVREVITAEDNDPTIQAYRARLRQQIAEDKRRRDDEC